MSKKDKPNTKKLTSKQLHFCRVVAAGSNQSDAYREAYDVGENTKPATVNCKASLLMSKEEIRARVEALIRQREIALVASAVTDREKVTGFLRSMIDNAQGIPSEMTKLRAADLLGKSIGLYKDVTVVPVSRTPEAVEAELMARLEADEQAEDDRPVTDDMQVIGKSVH